MTIRRIGGAERPSFRFRAGRRGGVTVRVYRTEPERWQAIGGNKVIVTHPRAGKFWIVFHGDSLDRRRFKGFWSSFTPAFKDYVAGV